MNEWELTPEQVLDVVKQSGVRCSVDTIEHKCKGTMTDYCTYAAEDAARAAQRRVVEWIERRENDKAAGFAAMHPSSNFTPRQINQRKSDALYALNLLAALKATVEGE